jgi:predicted nucleotidyltransferase/HEPN domain-containing protein
MLHTKGDADPVALEIARAAQEAAEPAVVILFGSRARGDHRPNSDVDLLVITKEGNPRSAEFAACSGVEKHRKLTGIYISANVIGMTKEQFDRCRLAKQHIAGQADTQGIIMSRERLEHSMTYPDDGYPAHWPATKQRLENLEEFDHHFNEMVNENHWNQKAIGFFAQQTVENALKGWLSAHNDDRNWDHNLNRLWEGVQEIEDWSGPELRGACHAVTELIEHTKYEDPEKPRTWRNWLTDYAVTYRYLGTSHQMTRAERLELQEKVNNAVGAIVDRIHAISGTTESDVYPEGVKPWDVVTE